MSTELTHAEAEMMTNSVPQSVQRKGGWQSKEYLVIEDIAELLSVSVASVRTKHKLGTIPQGKRIGRRLYWKRSVFVDWLDGHSDGSEPWSPPARRGSDS